MRPQGSSHGRRAPNGGGTLKIARANADSLSERKKKLFSRHDACLSDMNFSAAFSREMIFSFGLLSAHLGLQSFQLRHPGFQQLLLLISNPGVQRGLKHDYALLCRPYEYYAYEIFKKRDTRNEIYPHGHFFISDSASSYQT